MRRWRPSLSPEQRRQLEELAQALLSDRDLAFEMDQLAGELRALAPHLPWDMPLGDGEDLPGSGMGGQPMPLSAAVGAVEASATSTSRSRRWPATTPEPASTTSTRRSCAAPSAPMPWPPS